MVRKFVYRAHTGLDQNDLVRCYSNDWLRDYGYQISIKEDDLSILPESKGVPAVDWCHENLGPSRQLNGHLEATSRWKVLPILDVETSDSNYSLHYMFTFPRKKDAARFKLRFG